MHSEVVVVFPPTQLMQRNTNELLFFCARIKTVKELIRGTCTPQDSQENKPKLSGSVTPLRVKIQPAGAERRRLTKMKKKNRIKPEMSPCTSQRLPLSQVLRAGRDLTLTALLV